MAVKSKNAHCVKVWPIKKKNKKISIFTPKNKGGRILQVCQRRQDRETRVKTAKGSEDLTRSLAESHPCCNSHAHYKMFQKLVDVVPIILSRWCHNVSGFFFESHIGRSQWCFLVRRLVNLEIFVGGWNFKSPVVIFKINCHDFVILAKYL